MTIRFGAPGHLCVVVSVQVRGAPGIWCEVMTIKLTGQLWTSTMCRSPIIDILRKSSRTCDKTKWISQKRHLYSSWRPMYWSWDCLCRQQWKPLFILDQWKFGGIQEHQLRRAQEFVRYHAQTDLEHEAEILTVSTIDWKVPSWTRSTLIHNQVIKWTKAKVDFYTDSVSCLEKMQDHSGANRKSTAQLENFNSPILSEKNFELMENRLSSSGIFSQDLRHWSSSTRSKKTCKTKTLNQKNSEGRIIFMSMFNDIDWTKQGNSEIKISNSEQVKNYVKIFSRGLWSFLGLGD